MLPTATLPTATLVSDLNSVQQDLTNKPPENIGKLITAILPPNSGQQKYGRLLRSDMRLVIYDGW